MSPVLEMSPVPPDINWCLLRPHEGWLSPVLEMLPVLEMSPRRRATVASGGATTRTHVSWTRKMGQLPMKLPVLTKRMSVRIQTPPGAGSIGTSPITWPLVPFNLASLPPWRAMRQG